MAAHSFLLRRGLTRVLSTPSLSWQSTPSCSKGTVPGVGFTGHTCSNRCSFLGAKCFESFTHGFFFRQRHGRGASLSEDEISERVRLAARAAGSRKTGGGRPKVRRKRSVQWAPPAGTAGSEDLLESDVVLREDQALGQVVTSQANFMRVLVEKSGATAGGTPGTAGSGAPATGGGATAAAVDASTPGDAGASAGSPRDGSELLCVVRALLKKIRKRVLVGDRVLVSSIDWVEGRGMIEEVVKRRSQLEDPPIANVDHFLVLFALARPPLEPIQLSRFLVAAEHAGVPFTLALNKADLAPPGAAQAWKERLAGWGYNAHILSVEGGEGLEGVFHELSGKVTVVAGPSGAGKSSLINRLRRDSVRLAGANADVSGAEGDVSGVRGDVSVAEGDVSGTGGDVSEDGHSGSRGGAGVGSSGTTAAGGDGRAVSGMVGVDDGAALDTGDNLAVSAVSAKSGLGRHTTRSIVLIRLPLGGLLADTPGFSLPALSKITEQELPDCFPEVRQRLAAALAAGRHCAYKDCKHLAEPDCVVSGRRKRSDEDGNGAVLIVEGPDGSLEEREVMEYQDGFVPWERYEEYKQLMAEVKEREDKERWAYGTKRESAVRVRKTDGATGKPKVEPRLAPQKHRRESRKLAKQGLENLLEEEEEEEEEDAEGLAGSSEDGSEDGLEEGLGDGSEQVSSTGTTGASDPVGGEENIDGRFGESGGNGGSLRGTLTFKENGRMRGKGLVSLQGNLMVHTEANAFERDESDGADVGRIFAEAGTEVQGEGELETAADASVEVFEGSASHSGEATDEGAGEREGDNFKDWLKNREFEYKWWEENDAHLKADPRLASVKSTRDVQRHWRLRQEKVLENREAVFGKKGRP